MERPRADSEEKHGPGQNQDGRRNGWGGSITLKRMGGQSVTIPLSTWCSRAASLDGHPPKCGTVECLAALRANSRGNDRYRDRRRRRLRAGGSVARPPLLAR